MTDVCNPYKNELIYVTTKEDAPWFEEFSDGMVCVVIHMDGTDGTWQALLIPEQPCRT